MGGTSNLVGVGVGRYHEPLRAPDDAAVVIGIEDYAFLPDVPFAERDAQAVSDLLVYTIGVPADRVRVLSGPLRWHDHVRGGRSVRRRDPEGRRGDRPAPGAHPWRQPLSHESRAAAGWGRGHAPHVSAHIAPAFSHMPAALASAQLPNMPLVASSTRAGAWSWHESAGQPSHVDAHIGPDHKK